MTIHGWVCGPKIYEYKGWIFEHDYLGTWPLRKDLEPRKKAGAVFWNLLEEFMKLPEDEQKQYRIGGGCQQF
jgi:hypothetical protein